MAIEHGQHDMDEMNAARFLINRKTRHKMPTGMSVVTFSALADLDG